MASPIEKSEALELRKRIVEQHKARYKGRPCEFDPDLAEVILDRLADGESLTAICREPGMPHRATVLRWRNSQDGLPVDAGFRDAYARARRHGIEAQAEELVEIADGAEEAAQEARILAESGYEDEREANAAGRRAFRDEVETRKLRLDVRKFNAVKLLSEYREKVDVAHSGEVKGGVLVCPIVLDPEDWTEAAKGQPKVGPSEP